MAYLIAPGVPGALESYSGSKNTPGDLSTASDRRIFIDFLDVGQYFASKRYFNTIIGPWDLSWIVDNGLIYILTEYNVFWTDLARAGPVRLGILLINLSRTAYFDDLTLLNCRKLNLESTGVNIIFIRAIGC